MIEHAKGHPANRSNLLDDLAYIEPGIGLHAMISTCLVFPCSFLSRCSGNHPRGRAGAVAAPEIMPELCSSWWHGFSHTFPDRMFTHDLEYHPAR